MHAAAPRWRLRPSPWRLALVAALVGAVCPLPASGQRIAGHGDDAIQLPKGSWRVRIGGRWDAASEGADDAVASGRRTLGTRFRRDSLGIDVFPTLAAAEASARRLSGLGDLSLSVGQLDARLTERVIRLPISLEIGLFRRLAVGVTVPYIESRALVDLQLNQLGTTGAFGPNPARTTNLSAAATANTRALTTELQTARTALAQRLTECTGNAAANAACATVLAERATVEAILASSASIRDDLRALYGEAAGTGAPVVPIAGSTIDRLIGARVRGLGKQYERYGIVTVLDSLGPSGSRFRYGTNGLRRLLGDSAFGISNDSLRPVRRYGIGDVDVTATVLLIDQVTKGNRQPLDRFGAPRRFAVRSALEGGWRFGTAAADRPSDPFDIPLGQGAAALLVRSTTDVLLDARTWASITARAVLPQGDAILGRLPIAAGDPFPLASRTAALSRTAGRTIELEVAPRYALTRTLGVSAVWTLRARARDQYALRGEATGSAEGLAALADETHFREQRVGIAIGYSTLAFFGQRRSKHAVEMLYEHSEPVQVSGRLSAFATDRFEVRWYPGYPRR